MKIEVWKFYGGMFFRNKTYEGQRKQDWAKRGGEMQCNFRGGPRQSHVSTSNMG